ncbi:cytochrome d ubiquinol oxidase subunit II [Dactylosporangium sp. NPDC051485]|uniref:cytochrome d ubiquinol oxidase subunit II n=1 Tax=Dactylosporangium sp. NPDC051485 TaxID=3154846 RepID=UPI00343C8DE6
MSTLVAAGLLAGLVAYAVFAGADFGAGFWDLTAGGAERGRAIRAHIDHALGPVWEANHVWLIYCLVVAWSAFPAAFAAVTTTLYLPLGLAALGIVVRGAGFAFRKVLVRTSTQRLNGAAFAVSSVITPFFLGTVAGGIASGRVPAAGGGDPLGSWLNPTSLLTGALFTATCAYLAAILLAADARTDGQAGLEHRFRRRARWAAWACGALAVAGLAVTAADAHRLFDRLLSTALPATAVSLLAGAAALVLLPRYSPRIVRLLAGVAIAALVIAWGVAQTPYLLGTHTTVRQAAAPTATMVTLLLVFAAAAVLVAPSLALLYALQQRSTLRHDDHA